MKRTNIYLTEDQQRCLSSKAKEEGVTKSKIVRRILDEALLDTAPSRSVEDALAVSFGVWSDRSDEQMEEILAWRREASLQRLTR